MYKRLQLRMFWVHSNSVEPKVQCTLSLLCCNKHLHQDLQRPYNFFLHWQASQEGFPKKKIREREEKCFFLYVEPPCFRKHAKYTFKSLFYCIFSFCVCRFWFQSISLKSFISLRLIPLYILNVCSYFSHTDLYKIWFIKKWCKCVYFLSVDSIFWFMIKREIQNSLQKNR